MDGFNVAIGIFVLALQKRDAPNLAILPCNPTKSMIKVIFLNFGHVIAKMSQNIDYGHLK